MTLVVDVPPGYEAERAYVLEVLLSDVLGLEHVPGDGGADTTRVRLAGDEDGATVVVPDVLFATPPERWLTESALPAEPLRWVRPPRVATALEDEPLPVLYGQALPSGLAFDVTAAGVRFDIDVFGSAFFMLTRYEELARPERDQHGRFPAGASLARRAGFLDRPIVDEYAELLWGALTHCWPRLTRKRSHYRLHLSHDVDHPFAAVGAPVRQVLRQAAGDLAPRRDAGLAARRLLARSAERWGGAAFDPFNTFGLLMSASERHGLRSAFNFTPSRGDGPFAPSYDLSSPPILALLAGIAERGHEIGLHGSYDSFLELGRLGEEFAELSRVAEVLSIRQERWGGRQHFLRWENPGTWEVWEAAGLDYDATVGYADAAGFRTGTGRELPVFDLAARRRLRLRERPLHAMDGSLFGYMGLAPDDAARYVVRLAGRCRRLRTGFSLLVHNSALGSAAARRWYLALIDEIA